MVKICLNWQCIISSKQAVAFILTSSIYCLGYADYDSELSFYSTCQIFVISVVSLYVMSNDLHVNDIWIGQDRLYFVFVCSCFLMFMILLFLPR